MPSIRDTTPSHANTAASASAGVRQAHTGAPDDRTATVPTPHRQRAQRDRSPRSHRSHRLTRSPAHPPATLSPPSPTPPVQHRRAGWPARMRRHPTGRTPPPMLSEGLRSPHNHWDAHTGDQQPSDDRHLARADRKPTQQLTATSSQPTPRSSEPCSLARQGCVDTAARPGLR